MAKSRSAGRVVVCVLVLAVLAGCSWSGTPSPPTPGQKAGHGKKRGTQRPYTIRGKTYYPIASADGFAEEGAASWYGPNFHGKRTSCGEVYDMHKLTAAHKILPMHTMIRVTNLDNGKSVVVRVNDRGPFVSGRIVDMSKAGAHALGMHRAGTARVRLETVGGVPGLSSDGDLPGPFYVQVGAFVNKSNAERLLSRMQRMGYRNSRIHYREVDGQTFWRVHAGTFPTLVKADRARRKMDSEFKGAFIIAQ